MTEKTLRTCIITGGNSGIGKSATLQLAQAGLRVILACRNIQQAEEVCAHIQKETGNPQVFARQVDLSLLSDTKRFAQEYAGEFGMLDVLINNAADFDLARKRPLITLEGNEVQMATNLLAPFVLMQELMPLLLQSSDGRIINIGTQGLVMYPGISFNFQNMRAEAFYSPAKTYYQSKLGLLMISLAIQKRLIGTHISIYGVRVTNVKIDMGRYAHISPLLKAMYKVKSRFSIPPEEMAKVYVALATEEKRPGFYYDEHLQEKRCNRNAYDKEAQELLWRLCEESAGEA